MTKSEFIDIMGEIDNRLIESVLDIETPYEDFFLSDRPQVMYTSGKRHSALKYAICAAACLAVVFGITLLMQHINKMQTAPPYESADPSADSLDKSGSYSESSDSTKYEIQNTIKFEQDGLITPTIINSIGDVECKPLLRLTSDKNDASILRIFTKDDGFVIFTECSGNPRLFNFDRDGNSHGIGSLTWDMKINGIMYNLYSDSRFFFVTETYDKFASVFNSYKMTDLPECHSGEPLFDEMKYLYIDKDRENLILYNIETNYNTASVSATYFNLGTVWILDRVNAVSPGLATVTLIKSYGSGDSVNIGNEEYRTFLLELPTMKVIGQLPVNSEVIALDEENFLIATKENSSFKISRAVLQDGKLVESGTDPVTKNYHPNIVLSPNKKIMLIREWMQDDNFNDYMKCTAISTDDMQTIWEIGLEDSELKAGSYEPAAITDDAVLYLSGQGRENMPLYRIAPK